VGVLLEHVAKGNNTKGKIGKKAPDIDIRSFFYGIWFTIGFYTDINYADI